MKKIVGDYLKKDYKYDGLQAVATKAADAHKGAEKKLVAETFSIKLACDKKKWTFTEYDDLECKEKPKEFSAKWGDCVKGPDGGYIKMTGAIALKAAAAALVAFAGSQFWEGHIKSAPLKMPYFHQLMKITILRLSMKLRKFK